MPGRRRGARTGRGWDASPPRPRPKRTPTTRSTEAPEAPEEIDAEGPLWFGEESRYERRAGDTSPQSTDGEEDRRQRGAGDMGRQRRADGEEPPPKDPAEQARQICLRLLARRPYTRAELATALRKRGIDEEVADQVLDRYDEVGMIDDAAFAKAWVTSRHHGRGLARRALAGELRQRGVDTEVVGEALREVDEDTEAATARELVDRRLRGLGSVPPDVALRRLVGVLARKGYPPGLAIRVVKEALAEAEDERVAGYAELLDPDGSSDLVGETDEPIR